MYFHACLLTKRDKIPTTEFNPKRPFSTMTDFALIIKTEPADLNLSLRGVLSRNIAKGTTDPGVDCFNQSFWFRLVWLVCFSKLGWLGLVWFGRIGLAGLVWLVWIRRFSLVCLVW